MIRYGVPEGVPRKVKISEFATALGVDERTVRTWVDGGHIPTLQARRKATRYIRVEELARHEAEGWDVDWLTLF